MSTLAEQLIGEADDILKSVAAHGVKSGVEKSMRARAIDMLASTLEIESLDEVGGIEVNAYREDDTGIETCEPTDLGISGWAVYAWPLDGPTMHVQDFETREKAYEFALWLRKAIGEPLVPVSSMDSTLVKDEDVA